MNLKLQLQKHTCETNLLKAFLTKTDCATTFFLETQSHEEKNSTELGFVNNPIVSIIQCDLVSIIDWQGKWNPCKRKIQHTFTSGSLESRIQLDRIN